MTDDLKYYVPLQWRCDDTSVLSSYDAIVTANNYKHCCEMALRYYERLLELKITGEQARLILPLGYYLTDGVTP
jgi:thymidylate synthase ThyX